MQYYITAALSPDDIERDNYKLIIIPRLNHFPGYTIINKTTTQKVAHLTLRLTSDSNEYERRFFVIAVHKLQDDNDLNIRWFITRLAGKFKTACDTLVAGNYNRYSPLVIDDNFDFKLFKLPIQPKI